MNKKLTTSEFIQKAKTIHGNKYDYSKVEYVNSKTKICIICSEHGEFWQTPNNHISKRSCCSMCINNNIKSNSKEFIQKAKTIHGNKYDYSKVNYINNKTKICIICPEHGEFWQTPNSHFINGGCNNCGILRTSNNNTLSTKEFIQKAKTIHGDKYDYSKVEYIDIKTKVLIICPEHGEFQQTPNNHLKNYGCHKCKSSKGETYISNMLNSSGVKYIEQHRFKDCRNKNTLPFDFYLPELNTCIEYDGIQHFEPVEYFGGIKGLKHTKQTDKIKTEYCKKNNIRLIRIRYDEDVEKKIMEIL